MNGIDDNEMRSILNFDSLASAEALTGKSYKDDDATMAAGLRLQMRNTAMRKAALMAAGDTHFGSNFSEQLAAFRTLGFEVVGEHKFYGASWDDDEPRQETFLILWHPEGVLGTIESYEGTRRNTSHIYYNWRPSPELGDDWGNFTSSGGPFIEGVYPGSHDTREALMFNFEQLRQNGEFVSPWLESPFLWLLTYMDTRAENYDYKAITEARFAELPEHVRVAIGSPK